MGLRQREIQRDSENAARLSQSFGRDMGYMKQAEIKEAWQHLQGGGAGEEQIKGADGELCRRRDRSGVVR